MGFRSAIIPIKDVNDLMAAYLMQEAMDDTADYDTLFSIVGGIKYKGKLWLCVHQDGSSAFDFYDYFSPAFKSWKFLDDLPTEYVAPSKKFSGGFRIKGAEYFNTEEEFFEALLEVI